ncbi:YceH family protein [Rhodopirellula sp. P2]|uniref:YceH family protein n=1 Tax=Rhodopirellula sp. P2 TaxID=2127060 RepID=UPI0023688D7B|nr:YceH family protein [Rhodopirellula sp. P2]WDQ18955.1 YceH family protein [Rhodopirellula sp. P2]
MNEENAAENETSQPHPLSAAARRCLGVLVEKAKTTPDGYPLSLAGLITGCNQKSNRSPQMQVDESDALSALDELRAAGAAREIQGSGRVTKYRHAAYEWLGVDSPGAAIMTELLLRGPQTAGELRTRASRMHKFPDLDSLKTELDSLIDKGLVESLTPSGRGQTFSHRLYTPQERLYLVDKIKKQDASAAAPAKSEPVTSEPVESASGKSAHDDRIDQIQDRLDSVTAKLEALEKRLEFLES